MITPTSFARRPRKPVDHHAEVERLSRGIPKPKVMVSYVEGHLFPRASK